jgi:hypothetical protein
VKKNWFFIILLAIAALSLAGTAAYFSVFGISKLFYAAGLGIVILASSLEFAKLVTVSYVYRFWKTIQKGLRGFYIFAVVFIMFLTSIGIYGFLTGAYQKSANKIEIRDSQIRIAENKKSLFTKQLERINTTIESDNNRINGLNNARGVQERRLDTLYNRRQSRKFTESSITSDNEQLKFLNQDITEKMKQASSVNDSISYYDQKIVEYKSSDVSNEVGPYKFISDLTGLSMNKVVNIVALILILVFDPLAIALLIGVNHLTMMGKKPEEDKEEHPINIFKKLFKKKKKIIEPDVDHDTINWNESEPEPKKPETMYDLFVEKKEKEKEKKVIDKPETIQQEIPLEWNKQTETNDTVNDVVIEKKTLVGNDLSEDSENEDDYEEVFQELTFIEPGTPVYHEVFGKGKIIDVYPNQRVKIEFESGEIKELNTDFANLKEVKRVKKDWFDKYAEELKKKNDVNQNFYVQEKVIDGKSILEFTNEEVEHEEEIPYITIKIEPPSVESEPVSPVESVIEKVESETVVESEPVVEQPEIVKSVPPVEPVKPPVVEPDYYSKSVEQKDDIQSVTFGNIIRVNEPESDGLSSPRIGFTKDRKGRLL